MKRAIRDTQLYQRLDRLSADDRLFFISYGLFLITSILSTSFFYGYFEGKFYMCLQILCLMILGLYELRNGFLKAQQWIPLLVLVVMTLLGMYPALGSQTRLVPMMFCYIYCARRIPFAKIARFTLKYSIITLYLIVFAGYLGIIDNVVMLKAGRIRQFLGFRYALYLPGMLLNLTALWIYMRKDTISLLGAAIWGFANWGVFYLTDSRISFVLAEALLLAALLMKWLPKLVQKLRPLWALLIATFPVCGIGSVLMTVYYDSTIPWMRRLNSSLEGRLNLGKRSLETFGVKLLGQKIEWVGNGLESDGNSVQAAYNYVDCLYIKILQRYGIIFSVLLVVLLTWSMFMLWKRREYLILMISASVAVHCVLDDLSFVLHYNTFWMAMGLVLFAPAMLIWNGKTNQPPTPTEDPPDP